MQGQAIRSRMQWVTDGERPTKYFCALEHGNYINKTIKCLQREDNSYIRNQKEILHEIKCFYSNLFGYHETNLNECNAWKLLSQINTNKLSSAEAQSMEGYLTIDEVSNALQKTKHNKTPGLDGLPSEFYKVFCLANPMIKHPPQFGDKT